MISKHFYVSLIIIFQAKRLYRGFKICFDAMYTTSPGFTIMPEEMVAVQLDIKYNTFEDEVPLTKTIRQVYQSNLIEFPGIVLSFMDGLFHTIIIIIILTITIVQFE